MTNQSSHISDFAGKVSKDQLIDALAYALGKMETDPEISRKAYKMRLDNIISTDEYNPTRKRSGKPSNLRISNDHWVNHIPKHCIPNCLMIVEDIFKMLENGTDYDNLADINHLRNRITQLFINLRAYNLEQDHYNKIRHYILKTLNSYGKIDLMMKVQRFDLTSQS
jgi:uncharacterized protein (DUF433 family)